MTHFVLVELGCSHEISPHVHVISELDLDLTTASTAVRILLHVVEELSNGVVIGSCSSIKHEAELGFNVLAYALEEPFVTIDLTVVSLLDGKDEVDSPSFNLLSVEPKVPGTNLEQMEDILWNFVLWHIFMHQVLHFLHLAFSELLLHETLVDEQLLVVESFLSSIIFE